MIVESDIEFGIISITLFNAMLIHGVLRQKSEAGDKMMKYQTADELVTNDANAASHNLSQILESIDPSRFNDLLGYLISITDGELLLTRDQTACVLNISDEWLRKLTESGKLRSTEDGCFRVDDVYDYKLKQHQVRKKALKEMADIEKSVTTEIY